MDASKDVIERFLQKRPDDRIGMVGFATIPYAVAPLTLDHDWLVKRMEGLHTRMLDGRRTAIGDGVASAVNRLRESEAKSRIIILLTDGSNNWGTLSPENAAEAAAALNIKIYTIGAGGAGQGFMLGGSEVDETTLKKIAQTTGAQFYRARDLKTLDDVYAQIDQLEKNGNRSGELYALSGGCRQLDCCRHRVAGDRTAPQPDQTRAHSVRLK